MITQLAERDFLDEHIIGCLEEGETSIQEIAESFYGFSCTGASTEYNRVSGRVRRIRNWRARFPRDDWRPGRREQ